MDLSENKYITKVVAKRLAKDDWTMEKLATAYPPILEEYKGVGRFKAQSIVEEAKRLVNQAKLNEAMSRVIEVEPQEEPAVSVRVKRIKEQNQQ